MRCVKPAVCVASSTLLFTLGCNPDSPVSEAVSQPATVTPPVSLDGTELAAQLAESTVATRSGHERLELCFDLTNVSDHTLWLTEGGVNAPAY